MIVRFRTGDHARARSTLESLGDSARGTEAMLALARLAVERGRAEQAVDWIQRAASAEAYPDRVWFMVRDDPLLAGLVPPKPWIQDPPPPGAGVGESW